MEHPFFDWKKKHNCSSPFVRFTAGDSAVSDHVTLGGRPGVQWHHVDVCVATGSLNVTRKNVGTAPLIALTAFTLGHCRRDEHSCY